MAAAPAGDETLRGMARPALLLFAFCLIDGDEDAPRERLFAWIMAPLGLAIGTLQAVGAWLLTYGGAARAGRRRRLPPRLERRHVLTIVVFAIAFARGRGAERRRAAWIASAFVLASAARLASDALFPARIPLWINGLLLSTSIVPIVAVWIAVVRHRFFNVDFVGQPRDGVRRRLRRVRRGRRRGRGAAQLRLHLQQQPRVRRDHRRLDRYGLLFFKIIDFGARLVDRFIFRDRHTQRVALEFIGGYILDAETTEDVYRALLQDAPHALKLSFGGISDPARRRQLPARPEPELAAGLRGFAWPPATS